MATDERRHRHHGLLIALAAAFALSLGACDQQASTETAGRKVERKVEIDIADAKSGKAGTGGMANEDVALREKVKSALIAEPELKTLAIDVDVSDGAVTLYGTANSPAHRDKAAQVALNVEGVRSVANHLILLKDS
jgi:osmotically-inducible protein OsmY